MTILNPPEPISQKENFAALPQLPRDGDGPVFAEPWQAQPFAVAVRLFEQGHFTWKEWADALAEEIKGASGRGESDDGSHCCHYGLTTLGRLVAAKGLSDSAELLARKEAWAEAYRRTPLEEHPRFLPLVEPLFREFSPGCDGIGGRLHGFSYE